MANGTVAKAASKPKGEGIFARIGKFIRESYNETVKKSAWPTRSELWRFTLVVIFAVVVVALWIASIDSILSIITERLANR